MAGQMPEIHKALTVDLPRMRYFPQMLEFLALEGFKFTSIDLICQRVECRRRSIATGRTFRFVIRAYGRGDSQTSLLVGVKRPFLSRFYLEKHVFINKLLELERLLQEAADHEPDASSQVSPCVMALPIPSLDAVAA